MTEAAVAHAPAARSRTPRRKRLRAWHLVVAWALLAGALSWMPPFGQFSPVEELELRALDFQFDFLRGTITAPSDERVVVVGIDSRSLSAMPEPLGLWHKYLAQFLLALAKAEPAVVAFDVVMPDRSLEGVAPGLDRTLLNALVLSRRTYPTIMAVSIKEDGRPRGIHPAFINAAGTKPGFALFRVDPDGHVRRFDEVLGFSDVPLSTLVGETARAIGLNPAGGYIDYSLGRNFDYVPFIDVIEAARRGDETFLKRHFADKVVFLGMVLPYTDPVRVPVNIASWDVPLRDTPGVLLHAQVMRTVLAGRMVQRIDSRVVAMAALLAAMLGLLATTPGRAVALGLVLAGAFPFASLALLRDARFFPFAWPLLAGLGGIAVHQAWLIALRLLERRMLRSSFGGAVSPQVMEQLLEGRIKPDSGGENAVVCVLFSDIRGYTTLSEGMAPKDILRMLNRYFDRMVQAIHDEQGTVISFMGDGIMAVFGAPAPLPNAAEAGFRSAKRMLEGVKDFNAEIALEGKAPIAIGVGLHLGEAVIGHIGSKTRHDYTAIGDVTNVASRLESSTKEAGYRVVVSREVAEQLEDQSVLTHLGPVSLKGHTPVDAFGYMKAETAANPAPAETTLA